MHLVYHSSSASAALSTLHIRLTPHLVSDNLHRVHLKIVVAGVVFKKVFEGEPDLVYTYGWNKRNVYNQKVYTDTDARVFVGYEYTECQAIIWETQTTRLAGFQVDISDIGGWNINIHHYYNAFEGRVAIRSQLSLPAALTNLSFGFDSLLTSVTSPLPHQILCFIAGVFQKGDGSREDLTKHSLALSRLMGSGSQRDFQCEKSPCQGSAVNAALLNVVTITTGPDGSVYVGDYNLIRKIDPSGNVFTILHFR